MGGRVWEAGYGRHEYGRWDYRRKGMGGRRVGAEV